MAFPVQQETGPPAPSHCSSFYLPGRGHGFGLLFFLIGVSQKPGCLWTPCAVEDDPDFLVSCLYLPKSKISGREHCALPVMSVFINRLDLWALPPCCKHSEPHYTPQTFSLLLWFFFCAGNRNQGFVHVKHTLYHLATPVLNMYSLGPQPMNNALNGNNYVLLGCFRETLPSFSGVFYLLGYSSFLG